MEPTSHHPASDATTPAHATASPAHANSASSVEATTSSTAAHSAGAIAQPDSSLKGKLDTALESGKKWLNDSGVAEQAQQLPQKAKDLGNQAWTSISGLTTTQKAVGVGLLAAGIAFLAVHSSRSKKQAPEYRDRPRKSPFDHQPHTKDGDHAYDRRGQRPWGNSRYGTAATPTGKARVSSGSGYSSAAPGSRPTSSDRSTSVGSSSHSPGQRRDQGPASGSRYDANQGGSQNPNNLDDLNSAF